MLPTAKSADGVDPYREESACWEIEKTQAAQSVESPMYRSNVAAPSVVAFVLQQTALFHTNIRTPAEQRIPLTISLAESFSQNASTPVSAEKRSFHRQKGMQSRHRQNLCA